MDVNIINPVLAAFKDVLSQIGFQTIEKRGLALTGSTFPYQGILLNIAVVGPVKGVILIGIDEKNAEKCASKMMMGMPVDELNDLAKSALSELCNMICANACTQFSQANIKGLDISPPTILTSKDPAQAMVPVPETVVVDFGCDDGIEIKLFIGLS